MKKTKRAALLLSLAAMLLTILPTQGQNNTRSPYSIFGFGEQEHLGFASNLGMGGTGVSYFSNYHYNYLNPASMAYIDRVVFDFGGRFDRGTKQAGESYKDYNNGNFSYMSLAFTIYKKERTIKSDTIRSESGNEEVIHKKANILRVNSGFGFKPYTNFGAEFLSRYDTAFGSFISDNVLTGGISALHFNNSVLIKENLSFGIKTSFIWGQRIRTQLLTSTDDLGFYSLSDESIAQYKGMLFDFGVGYKYELKKNVWLMLGASYEISNSIQRKDRRVIRSLEFNPNGSFAIYDTLFNNEGDFQSVSLPSGFKLGATLMFTEKVAFSADYHQGNWNSLSNSEGWTDSFTNFNSLNLGVELRPESNPFKSMSKVSYRFGYSMATLPGVVRNETREWQQIKQNGISFGIGIPVVRDVFTLSGRQKYKSMINISGEYITRGTSQNGLIREELYRITLGMALTDLWFIKKKIF